VARALQSLGNPHRRRGKLADSYATLGVALKEVRSTDERRSRPVLSTWG